jgi:hypothetical protein
VTRGWQAALWAGRLLLLATMFMLAKATMLDGFQWHDVSVLVVETVAGIFVIVALGPLMGGGWGD